MVAKEDENLVVSDQTGLVVDDAEIELCEFAKSDDCKDAFFSVVSRGEHVFCFSGSGGTEGFNCDSMEIEAWFVGNAATRHIAPNGVSETNYRECDGLVRVANGVALQI